MDKYIYNAFQEWKEVDSGNIDRQKVKWLMDRQ